MIVGQVNSEREAIVELVVIGNNNLAKTIHAVIDTGYTGFLTLSPALTLELQLTWYMQQQGMLGDGSVRLFNVYEASIIWDGQERAIEVNEADADCLVGMGLMEGYELVIRNVPGGVVTLSSL
jgi:clan AA aspartic protease